jgi:hypothetical protein
MASPSDPAGTGGAAVEQSPLRTTFVRSHSRFVLSWPDDGALEIKYHRMVRVVAWILCILGWPVLLLGLLGLIGQLMKPEAAGIVAVGLLLLWGGSLGLMGVWLLGPRHRFDASDGWMTVRHFWRTRRRPLEQIRAVQMIDAGWFGTKYDEGLDGDSPVKFLSYQLNLVLDDPDEPRVFVTYNSDFTDMARKAKILSDFLGVPLLAAPRVHELVQTYRGQDAQAPPGVSGARRFRGSDALRSVPDRRLPEPYRSWIDEAQPLPAQVRLRPRSVAVIHDLGVFVILGFMIIGMDVLVVALFLPALAAANAWVPILVVGAVCLLLALIPLSLLRRLCITLGAWRRLKRGTLRQGILVGPEGVLVRMEPNRCHAIPLDRFVNAKIEASASTDVSSDFVIETLDGPVAFFVDRSSGHPEQINQWVAELRSGSLPIPG